MSTRRTGKKALKVTFQSLTRSKRKWSVVFNVGKNNLAAVEYAHKNNAAIISAKAVNPPPFSWLATAFHTT